MAETDVPWAAPMPYRIAGTALSRLSAACGVFTFTPVDRPACGVNSRHGRRMRSANLIRLAPKWRVRKFADSEHRRVPHAHMARRVALSRPMRSPRWKCRPESAERGGVVGVAHRAAQSGVPARPGDAARTASADPGITVTRPPTGRPAGMRAMRRPISSTGADRRSAVGEPRRESTTTGGSELRAVASSLTERLAELLFVRDAQRDGSLARLKACVRRRLPVGVLRPVPPPHHTVTPHRDTTP